MYQGFFQNFLREGANQQGGGHHFFPSICAKNFLFSMHITTAQVDISIISSLVEFTLHSLDDSVLPTANWVLKLKKHWKKLPIYVTISLADIQTFQDSVGKRFIYLKNNRFSSQDIVSSFSIFDQRRSLALNHPCMQDMEKTQLTY